MTRKYFKTPVDELEELFRQNLHKLQVLGEIREELSYRETDRAKRLLREIEAIVSGTLSPGPKPLRPDGPDDQGKLL